MTILTENIVLSRTRAQDLNSVRKLNCCLKHPVLSESSQLCQQCNKYCSVNNIITLIDFAYCRNLQELYLRKNKIEDLNEVCYLQVLPRLHSLWLAENPCAETESYRLTVLRALPHLQKLDNIMVQPDEVERARIHGSLLIPPRILSEEISPESSHCSPIQDQKSQDLQDSYVQNLADNFQECSLPTVLRQESPHDSGIGDFSNRFGKEILNDLETRAEMNNSIKSHHQEQRPRSITLFEDEERPNSSMTASFSSQGSTTPLFSTPQSHQPHQHVFHARVQTLVDHSGRRGRKNADINCETIGCDSILEDQSGVSTRRSSMSDSQSSVLDFHHPCFPDPDGAASSGDGYGLLMENQRIIQNEMHYNVESKNAQQKSGSPGRLLPKGGKNRNSNILSAVLCLIKELDYASLEVVETAIHCRMEEMDD
ncbi:uncharacterized protein LOC111631068 [Centruroides sculpturatus]|uniref:uncharacterized protein LOC111631068 n=1 Tax=Centruroides sculpturatus TaxID=218467 RepID=UPI000C6C9DC1|nr:uncharacterized protein LOC111631068 [Centruroides sculpturatus]